MAKTDDILANSALEPSGNQRVIEDGVDKTPRTTQDFLDLLSRELACACVLIQRPDANFYLVNHQGQVFNIPPAPSQHFIQSGQLMPVISYLDGSLTVWKDMRFTNFIAVD